MSFKSQTTKDAEERIKQSKKTKGNNEMKTPSKSTVRTVLTVFTTLAVVAAFAATFYAGTQYQDKQHEQIVEAQQSAVTAALKTDEQ